MEQALSMQHCNGHQFCVMDLETGGRDPNWNEILQIAIVPLDADLNVRKDVIPFYIEMKPENPERVEKEALNVNKLELHKIMMRGHDPEKAKDMLRDWVSKLGLPTTRYGEPKRIIPVGANLYFDIPFFKQWLGIEMYDEFFYFHPRDVMVNALFLNDRAAFHGEPVPFSKVGLQWLARKLGVVVKEGRAHDALADCVQTAAVYRQMVLQGLF